MAHKMPSDPWKFYCFRTRHLEERQAMFWGNANWRAPEKFPKFDIFHNLLLPPGWSNTRFLLPSAPQAGIVASHLQDGFGWSFGDNAGTLAPMGIHIVASAPM